MTIELELGSINLDDYFLLDVREPKEFHVFHLPNSTLIPLLDLNHRIEELSKVHKTLVICQRGIRSLKAAQFLREHGFQSYSLKGGLDAYAKLFGG